MLIEPSAMAAYASGDPAGAGRSRRDHEAPPEAEAREGDGGDQELVGVPLPRIPEEEPARGEHRRADQARAAPEERFAQEQRQREAEEAAQHRGQPGRDLVEPAAAELGHARRRPEVERRLVRIDLAEEMRHEPRSSADHLARGERVLRLEGMAQDLAAESRQIEERAQSEDQQERARGARGRSCGASRRHGLAGEEHVAAARLHHGERPGGGMGARGPERRAR